MQALKTANDFTGVVVGDIGIGTVVQAVVEAGNIDVIDGKVAQRAFRRIETDAVDIGVFDRRFIFAVVNPGADALYGEIFHDRRRANRNVVIQRAVAGIAAQEIVMVAFRAVGDLGSDVDAVAVDIDESDIDIGFRRRPKGKRRGESDNRRAF